MPDKSPPDSIYPERIRRAAARRAAHFLVILVIGGAVYSNTLHAPFQWDEHKFLIGNPFVTQGATVESLRPDDELYKMVAHRYVGFLTFRLNYLAAGYEVTGYHLVNIALHLFNCILAYLLVLAIFATPLLRGSPAAERAPGVALIVALLYAAHPIQTEAVNYVHQRPALITAGFYLLAVLLYARWRSGAGTGQTAGDMLSPWYLGALAAAVLAMKSKENAFTLPAALVLLEFIFFSGSPRKRLSALLPLLATMLIIPLTALVGMDRSWALSTKTHEYLSRWEYFTTELRVMLTYLRLLLLPTGQRLMYDYPRYSSLCAAPVLMSAVFLLAVAGFTGLLFRSAASGRHELRIVVFGIIWFFLAISVESSVFPTPYVIQEYRLYLPSFGIFLALVAGIGYVTDGWAYVGRRIAGGLLVILLAGYASASYARNAVWNDVLVFWSDVARKSPGLDIPHIQMGTEYYLRGRYDDAIREYRAAIAIDPNFSETHFNLGLAYNKKGLYEDAMKEFQTALILEPGRYEIPFNLGITCIKLERYDQAIVHLREALALNSSVAEIHYAMGIALEATGRPDEAAEAYRMALSLKPDHAGAAEKLKKIRQLRQLP